MFERDGEIVGLIVPKAGPEGGTDAQEAIRRAVSEVSQTLLSYQRLAAYAVTRETIPRTRLGKPRRHLLEDLYDQALRGEPGATPERRGPMPLDEMSADDRALLEDPAARQAWDWLARRYADRRLTPDSDLNTDLGIDSMEWLNISLELSQTTGADLSEEAIARVHTVRDLLSEVVSGGDAGGASRFSLDDPEAALDERERRWLRPLGPLSRGLSLAIYWINRGLVRGLFRLRISGRITCRTADPSSLPRTTPACSTPSPLPPVSITTVYDGCGRAGPASSLPIRSAEPSPASSRRCRSIRNAVPHPVSPSAAQS